MERSCGEWSYWEYRQSDGIRYTETSLHFWINRRLCKQLYSKVTEAVQRVHQTLPSPCGSGLACKTTSCDEGPRPSLLITALPLLCIIGNDVPHILLWWRSKTFPGGAPHIHLMSLISAWYPSHSPLCDEGPRPSLLTTALPLLCIIGNENWRAREYRVGLETRVIISLTSHSLWTAFCQDQSRRCRTYLMHALFCRKLDGHLCGPRLTVNCFLVKLESSMNANFLATRSFLPCTKYRKLSVHQLSDYLGNHLTTPSTENANLNSLMTNKQTVYAWT